MLLSLKRKSRDVNAYHMPGFMSQEKTRRSAGAAMLLCRASVTVEQFLWYIMGGLSTLRLNGLRASTAVCGLAFVYS